MALRACGVPYLVSKWDSRAMRILFRRHAPAHDVVYFDHLGTTAYLDEVESQRIVIEEHNIEHQILARFADHAGPLLGKLARLEARSTLAYEARVLGAAHSVITITERDKRACAELTQNPAHVVPMCVELRAGAEPSQVAATSVDVGYIGSLRWHPNKLGLSWFCTEVWPRVRERHPTASFEIAGSGMNQSPAAWRQAGVTFSGFVASAHELYARARVIVAPVLGGSGLSVKVLDALAAGAAVVTTRDGAAGLAANDALLVTDDPSDFAAHIVRLLEDERLRSTLANAGARFISQHHSAERSAAALQSALASALPRAPLR
jgi:glycosyltransferase involved in cell wall biosynthesis